MPTNPFKPPESDVKDDPPPGSPLRAILVGLAVDIGGSLLVGVVLTLLYHSQLVSSDFGAEAGDATASDIPMNSPIEMISIVLSAGCSVLGGYVCARIVRRNEYRVGATMAAISAALSMLMEPSSLPDDLAFLFTLTTAACVMLGVKFGRERSLRPPPPSADEPRP